MLGIYNVRRTIDCPGQRIDRLPPPPALEFGAVLAGIESDVRANEFVTWANLIAPRRADLALGVLFVRRPFRHLRQIAVEGPPVQLVLSQDDLIDQSDLRGALEPLLRATTAGRLFRTWKRLYGGTEHGDLDEILRILASAAGSGLSLKDALGGTGWSARTVRRRLSGVSYPPPASLLRQGRALAFDLRMERGVGKKLATRLCGWSSERARRKFMKRVAHLRIPADEP